MDRLSPHWPKIAFVATVIGLIAWYAISRQSDNWAVVSADQQRRAAFAAHMQQRAENWATVVREKELSPGEYLKLVEIPDRFGLTSARCYIYTNAVARSAQFVCPDGMAIEQAFHSD